VALACCAYVLFGSATNKFIHTPWKMPPSMQQEIGCVIGQDYPAPIVEHAWARERVLAAYAQAREAA
jgi:deoxyribodipyrimidine photo-lyase